MIIFKSKLISNKKPKLTSFSKLKTLKERWDDKDLSVKKLRNYNKWDVNEKFKNFEIESRLEHYLCKNILVVLKGKDDLFLNKDRYFFWGFLWS